MLQAMSCDHDKQAIWFVMG